MRSRLQVRFRSSSHHLSSSSPIGPTAGSLEDDGSEAVQDGQDGSFHVSGKAKARHGVSGEGQLDRFPPVPLGSQHVGGAFGLESDARHSMKHRSGTTPTP